VGTSNSRDRRRFTLFAPEGPIERQITAAVSSIDSLATGQKRRLPAPLLYFVLFTYRRLDYPFSRRTPSRGLFSARGHPNSSRYLGLRTTGQAGYNLDKMPITPWELPRPLCRLALRRTDLFVLGYSLPATGSTTEDRVIRREPTISRISRITVRFAV
jgi:hypothetical protein